MPMLHGSLGEQLAKADIRLVYGGGAVGLMGILAKSVLDNGGNVTGIIPEFLQEREVMLDTVQDLIVTKDMHERKRKMFEAAQAFVALPGRHWNLGRSCRNAHLGTIGAA